MTTNDFIEIIGKKICTEATKVRIRRDYPPHIAEWKCNVIDMVEKLRLCRANPAVLSSKK